MLTGIGAVSMMPVCRRNKGSTNGKVNGRLSLALYAVNDDEPVSVHCLTRFLHEDVLIFMP